MNVILAAYCYIATIVGAGFASGQEILSFFVLNGRWGLLGIATSCILFAIYSYAIAEGCRVMEVHDYNSLLQMIMKPIPKKVSSIVTFVFMCAVYCAMVACMGEMLRLLFGCDPIWGRVALSIAACALIMLGDRASLKINGVLGIIIVLGMISCTLYMLRFREHQTFFSGVRALVSGAGYSGYNLLGAGVVIASFSYDIKTRRDALMLGLISGAVLFVMMSLVWGLLSLYYRYIPLGEIPMLTMAMRQNSVIMAIFSIMLVLAVVTTAVSSGVGISTMARSFVDNKRAAILIMLGGIGLGGVGFSHIINIAYRICGYIGIIINIAIVVAIYKKQRKDKKNKDKRSIDDKIINKS